VLNGYIYEKKWCQNCGRKLIKWGKNRDGSQRYFCKNCQQTKTRKRPEISQINHENLFKSWLLGKYSKEEIVSKYSVSRRTLTNWFKSFWKSEPEPKQLNISGKVIVIDGKYIAKDECVLIATCDQKVSDWYFSQRENSSSWGQFFNNFRYIPFAIVCDGQKGMSKAIKLRFPGVIIQRCQFPCYKVYLLKINQKSRKYCCSRIKVTGF